MPEAERPFGPYKLGDVLGEGGQGQVCRAQRPGLPHELALKLIRLSRDPEKNAELRSRARRELSALRQVTSTAVVRGFGIHEEATSGDPISPGTLCIEFEFIPGQTLASALSSHPPTPDEVLGLVTQLVEGLQKVHSAGVLHRDVKAANIVLRDGKYADPVLVDFGYAALDGATQITSTIAAVGTVQYMAPEVLRSARAASAASDQYALATVALDALGAALLPGGDWTDRENTLVQGVRPRYPGVATCLEKARARNPDGRFGSVEAFGSALRQTAEEDGLVRKRALAKRHSTVANDVLARKLLDAGFEVVDKRPKGGLLWVLADQASFAQQAAALAADGIHFEFKADGPKRMRGSPAWWLRGSGPLQARDWEGNRPGSMGVSLLPVSLTSPSIDTLLAERLESPLRVTLQVLGRDLEPGHASPWWIWSFRKGGLLERQWKKCQVGGVLLFVNSGQIFARSRIVHKAESVQAARLQWPDGGASEPLILLLSSPEPIDVPVGILAEVLEFSPNYRVQAFTTLSPRQSEILSVGLGA